MAFDEVYIQPQLWDHFSFFKTTGLDGTLSETVAPEKKFKLAEIRAHFSVAFVSVEYLKAYISAAKGSEYNTVLLSYLVSGSTDIFIHYSDPLLFLSDDHLVFELSLVSGTNVIGLNVVGWAVQG